MSVRNEAWECGLKYEYVWRFSALSVKNETVALKYRKIQGSKFGKCEERDNGRL